MQDVASGTATTRGLINPSTLTRRTALTIPALLLNNPVVTIYRSLYFVYFHLLLLSVLIIYILGQFRFVTSRKGQKIVWPWPSFRPKFDGHGHTLAVDEVKFDGHGHTLAVDEVKFGGHGQGLAVDLPHFDGHGQVPLAVQKTRFLTAIFDGHGWPRHHCLLVTSWLGN